MLKGNKIILASSSLSRRKILNNAGVKYRSIKPFVDEESLKKGFKGSTKKLALMLAEKKALSVSKKYHLAVNAKNLERAPAYLRAFFHQRKYRKSEAYAGSSLANPDRSGRMLLLYQSHPYHTV